VNVRVKGRAVNSVFLVQLRKIVATDFRGSARMKTFWKICCQAALWAWVLCAGECRAEFLGNGSRGLCTGVAQEMQKAVVSGKGSVASLWYCWERLVGIRCTGLEEFSSGVFCREITWPGDG
jgi:hypothetical protein